MGLDMSQLHRIDWCDDITTHFHSKGTRFESWQATLRWLVITEGFSLPLHTAYHVRMVHSSTTGCRPQWPLRSAAACLLGLWVPIPSEAWLFVFFDCCWLSGRGPCVGLITRLEESYRVWCVWVWSWSLDNEGALASGGLLHNGAKNTGCVSGTGNFATLFFLVRQHWGGCRYRHFAEKFKAF